MSGAKKHTHDGLSLTACEWAERLGVSHQRIRQKLKKYGSPFGPAVQRRKPAQKYSSMYDSRVMTVCEWALALGVTQSAIRCRIRKHGDPRVVKKRGRKRKQEAGEL